MRKFFTSTKLNVSGYGVSTRSRPITTLQNVLCLLSREQLRKALMPFENQMHLQEERWLGGEAHRMHLYIHRNNL